MKNTKIKFKYFVPNLFTALSLISGIFALKFSLQSDLIIASWLVAVSMFCDGLDGKLARLLNASSRFGSIFDTISDFFAFGIVPAIIAYIAVMHQFKIWGLLVTLIYITCGALRLTRFMQKTVTISEKKPFIGLPIPAAAGMIASYVIFNYYLWGNIKFPISFPVIILLISFLMISRIQYLPIEKKDMKVTGKMKLFYLLALVSLMLTIKYYYLIFILWILIYVLYGLVRNLVSKIR